MNFYEVQNCMFNTTEIRLVEKKGAILNCGGTSTLGSGLTRFTTTLIENSHFWALVKSTSSAYRIWIVMNDNLPLQSTSLPSAAGRLLVHTEMCIESKGGECVGEMNIIKKLSNIRHS